MRLRPTLTLFRFPRWRPGKKPRALRRTTHLETLNEKQGAAPNSSREDEDGVRVLVE